MSAALALRLVLAAIVIVPIAYAADAAPLPVPTAPGVRVQNFGVYAAGRDEAVVVRAPATFTIPLTVPPAARLVSAAAVPDRVWTADVADSAEAVRFRVLFESGGTSTVLFDRTIDIARRPADRRWFDFGRDLSPWAGQQGVLRFETTLPETSAAAATAALWARPDVATCDGSKPSALVIVVDSLRADRLSAMGYRRRTTPNLDDFARDATRFDAAYAAAPTAIPSVPQLLSGHLFLREQARAPSALFGAGRFTMSRAIVKHPYAAFWMKPGRASFQTVVSGDFDARAITRAALRWTSVTGRCQHVLYLHYGDTHTPYRPPERYARKFIDPDADTDVELEFGDVTGVVPEELGAADRQRAVDLYDGAVAWTDRQIGVLLRALARRGQLDHMLVIVTSDHGEELWDRDGFFHGHSLYDEQIHVPLLVRHPRDGHGRVVTSIASTLDVAPTVVEAAGFSPIRLDGMSLLPALRGDTASNEGRPVLATVSIAGPRTPPRHAVRTTTHKLIRDVDDGSIEVYDVVADPREKRNLGPAAPGGGQLLATLDAVRQRLADVGDQLRIVSRSDRRVAYTITLTPNPVAPIHDPDRLTLEPNDEIRVGETAASLTVHGAVDPGDEDRVRMDVISGGKLDVAITLDGEPAPAGTLRIGVARRAVESPIDLVDPNVFGGRPDAMPTAPPATGDPATTGTTEPEITVHFWRIFIGTSGSIETP